MLTITDADIARVECIFSTNSEIRFDDHQREIIKDLHTPIVYACPGSGKTTVLLAKLVILATKWEYKFSGICVLSFTNAARIELQQRLGGNQIGNKVLEHPHFVGTIQSFIDTMISIPYLKSKGINDIWVEGSNLLEKRFNRIPHNYQYFFMKNHLSNDIMEYKNTFGGIDERVKTNTHSGNCVVDIIRKSIFKGEVTYGEMKLLANSLLKEDKKLHKYIASRFPYVFIDEAQDTTNEDSNILDTCFNNSIVFQKYGDPNQRIYSPDSMRISNEDILDIGKAYLPNSYRFCDSIASVASPFAQDPIPKFHGFYKENIKAKNTVILYNKDSILRVGEEYGKILLSTFSNDELRESSCWAISQTVKPKENSRFTGHCLSDYFPLFSRELTDHKNLTCFETCYEIAKAEFEKTQSTSVINYLVTGIIKTLGQKESKWKSIRPRFLDMKEELSKGIEQESFIHLAKMFLEFEDSKTDQIIENLREVFPELDYTDFYTPLVKKGSDIPKISYPYRDSITGRELTINLGTIHSVKGQTHLATLVVDSVFYDYNIYTLIKKLRKNKDLKDRDIARSRCLFVGLTRPRSLACMALDSEFIELADKDWLISKGWSILEL
ncbi:MAG: UvrD-helicase domain-containing protein [Sphaerochaeta sp.]|nr:UvrD-helicase domain-containing protein [Sphaerochaeta sp.]